jgi:hypothetical protein
MLTVATSIAPRSIEKQAAATTSWRALGMDVVSLNSKEEIQILRPQFPDVRFVEVRENALKLLGRPYVFINDFLSHCVENKIERFGIVNSDIILRATEKELEEIYSAAPDSMLYGCRLDVNEQGAEAKYELGFDYFFFSHEVAARIDRSIFALGAPWWDYFFPLAAVMNGVKVKRIKDPIGIHVMHPYRYTRDEYVMLGLATMAYFYTALRNKKGVDHAVQSALRCLAFRQIDLTEFERTSDREQLFVRVVRPGAFALREFLGSVTA